MALKRTFMIGVLLACGMLTSVTKGQDHTPGTYFDRTPESSEYLPFNDGQGLFGHYDAQLFAPLEFTNGKEKKPSTGFNFSIDRSYISLDRATQIDSTSGADISNGSEFHWGTNYELGWLGENDKGWNLRFDNLTGSFFTNGGDILVTNPAHVETRFVTVQLNRIFRQALSSGATFEPFFGGRFTHLSDEFTQDTGPNRFLQDVNNSSFGLQAGARYAVRRGRWRFSYRGSAAATYNQQRYRSTDINNGVIPGTMVPSSVATIVTNLSDQAFVPVIDGGLDASYHISRDLSLNFGVLGNYSWSGIARVNTAPTAVNGNSGFGAGTAFQPLDENLVAVGFKFGIEWRR